MEEKQDNSSRAKTEPTVRRAPTPVVKKRPNTVGKTIALVAFCGVASFFGAWAFVASGIIPVGNESMISENRERLVMQEGEVVAEVAKRVSPSVVSIVTASEGRSSLYGSVLQEGAGTGFIVSKDGYVITNKHVVGEGTRQVDIVLADGTRHEDVEIVGRDPLNDIAFLKLDGDDFPSVELADSNKTEIGQKVVAIGNALGQYQNSVTSGIVSGIGRPITAEADANSQSDVELFEDLFQTDAAINPGNSGGPLVNLQGEVVGINTAIIEDAQGIGFSIPVNVAKGLLKGVFEENKVSRAYMGVQYVTLTPEIAKELDISVTQGAYVGSGTGGGSGGPVAGGPADEAGIEREDIITKVNDDIVGDRSGLAALLAQHSPGETIKVTYTRGGDEKTVDVTLTEYKD